MKKTNKSIFFIAMIVSALLTISFVAAETEELGENFTFAEVLDRNITSNKPNIELFVMSRCPYGVQVEMAMVPVLETLGDKVDFELKFVDYVMHGKEEFIENNFQYCVQKEYPEELNNYLQCFARLNGNPASHEYYPTGCLKANKSVMDGCFVQLDDKFNISEISQDEILWKTARTVPYDVYKEDNEKYGITGSPTLIINGVEVPLSDRSPAGILNSVCSFFDEKPIECLAELSEEVVEIPYIPNTLPVDETQEIEIEIDEKEIEIEGEVGDEEIERLHITNINDFPVYMTVRSSLENVEIQTGNHLVLNPGSSYIIRIKVEIEEEGTQEGRLILIFSSPGRVGVKESVDIIINGQEEDEDDYPDEPVCFYGCSLEGSCLPYGTRILEDENYFYCSISGEMDSQKTDNLVCQNDYECKSNQCINARCCNVLDDLESLDSSFEDIQDSMDDLGDDIGDVENKVIKLGKKADKTNSLLEKIWDSIKRMFGGKAG